MIGSHDGPMMVPRSGGPIPFGMLKQQNSEIGEKAVSPELPIWQDSCYTPNIWQGFLATDAKLTSFPAILHQFPMSKT